MTRALILLALMVPGVAWASQNPCDGTIIPASCLGSPNVPVLCLDGVCPAHPDLPMSTGNADLDAAYEACQRHVTSSRGLSSVGIYSAYASGFEGCVKIDEKRSAVIDAREEAARQKQDAADRAAVERVK